MAKAPEASEPQAPAKSGGGFMGIAVLALAALASSFGTAYFLTPSPAAPAVTEQADCACDVEQPVHIKPMVKGDQSYVEVQEILITIGSAPATRYLKMNLAIATNKSGTSKVKSAEPVLVDAFINYLRSVELSDFEDPAFYSRMREQLSRRAELVLGSDVSGGVLITEFLLR